RFDRPVGGRHARRRRGRVQRSDVARHRRTSAQRRAPRRGAVPPHGIRRHRLRRHDRRSEDLPAALERIANAHAPPGVDVERIRLRREQQNQMTDLHLARVAAAALAAFVVYFALGGAFFTNPAMRAEFSKYRAVYRDQDSMKTVMPIGMLGMLLSMVALAVLFAMIHPGGAGPAAGVQFGLVVALYALGSFVLHNH